MGGEYLPDLAPSEVEIARITIASTLTRMSPASTPAAARRRIYYRVVDEYEGDTLSEKRTRTSTRPLTLGELEKFFNGAWSIFKVLNMNFCDADYDLGKMLRFVDASTRSSIQTSARSTSSGSGLGSGAPAAAWPRPGGNARDLTDRRRNGGLRRGVMAPMIGGVPHTENPPGFRHPCSPESEPAFGAYRKQLITVCPDEANTDTEGVTMTKPKRVALYARVSTDGQTTENQQRELRTAVERNGWTIAAEYVDHGISGAKGRKDRPAVRCPPARGRPEGVRCRRGLVGGSPGSEPAGSRRLPQRPAGEERRPVPAPAGAGYVDAIRQGDVRHAGRVRRVRAVDHSGAGEGRACSRARQGKNARPVQSE